MASIPVDLLNPGQVFACLGFLEAAEVLLGEAHGGFNWKYAGNVMFELRAQGNHNPFDAVLGFLAEANIQRWGPFGYVDPTPKKKAQQEGEGDTDEEDQTADGPPIELAETFPAPEGDPMALPVRLTEAIDGQTRTLNLGHWADESSRNNFKRTRGTVPQLPSPGQCCAERARRRREERAGLARRRSQSRRRTGSIGSRISERS